MNSAFSKLIGFDSDNVCISIIYYEEKSKKTIYSTYCNFIYFFTDNVCRRLQDLLRPSKSLAQRK
jgi:hypothetical protein